MSLLAHILRFDLRRYRWLIVGWVVITITTVAVQAAGPFVETARRRVEAVDVAMTFGWLAQLLLSAILLPLVVQTHPAAGTTAFWMTRPFPPTTLVRSKLALLAAVFVLVPAVCDAAAMLFYRVPMTVLGMVVLEVSLSRAVVALAFALVAAATTTFARFALVLGALVVAITIVINVAIMVSMLLEDSPVPLERVVFVNAAAPIPIDEPDPTAWVAASLATIVVTIVLITHQYRKRSIRHTLAGVAAGLVFVAALGLLWPGQRLTRSPAAPEWAHDASKVRLVGPSSGVHFEQRTPIEERTVWRVSRADASLENVPAGWLATTRLLRGVVTLDDGRRLESGPDSHPASLRSTRHHRSSDDVAFRELLDVDDVGRNALGGSELLVLMAGRPDQLPATEFAGAYHGEFAVDLTRISIAAVLPLTGGIYQSGAYRMEIVDTKWQNSLMLRVRVSDAHPVLDPGRRAGYQYFVRHPRRRVALAGHEIPRGARPFGSLFFMPAGMHLSVRSPFSADAYHVQFPGLINGGATAPDESWLRDAELVLVRFERGGTVRRTLDIPRIRFVPSRAQ